MMIGSHSQARVMRFVELDGAGLQDPCVVCVSHQLNPFGYLYKGWSVGGKIVREAFHRFILRAHLGWTEWPKGLETEHICGTRACCQPSHLMPIQRSDHKKITNRARYAERNERARLHWMARACTINELAKAFDVNQTTAGRWIREWKAEAPVA